MTETKNPPPVAPTNSRSAFLVGLGIFLSRIAGLIRERIFAHYFGNSDASDAFKAALKIPNFLQNLFGEGVLSASFIPVYAGLLGQKDEKQAAQVASVIGSLLFVMTSLLVLAGVFATPWMIDAIAPGFSGEKRELTIHIVQILFPGTGFLVMSAWCLGILNSHRRFFLSYAAPVIWNFSIIAVLLIFGRKLGQTDLAIAAAWGLVLGSFLQFAVQLPLALRLGKQLRPQLSLRLTSVRMVLKNFAPVVISRGVVQVSAYVDNILASLLPTGAVSALAYSQTIYLLPVSLFGMSVSVSELPEMSQAQGSHDEVSAFLRQRLNAGLQTISFFIIPSAAAFLFLGDIVVAALFQTGQFDQDSTLFVWGILAGSTVGLLAGTMGRLYASCFYSLKDTRTPLKLALLRVFLTTSMGWIFAFYVPAWLGLEARWGTAGLTASAGLAGWVEFFLLRRRLNQRIGRTGLAVPYQGKLWLAAVLGTSVAVVIKPFFELYPIWRALFCLGSFGLIYFGICFVMKIPQVHTLWGRVRRRWPRSWT